MSVTGRCDKITTGWDSIYVLLCGRENVDNLIGVNIRSTWWFKVALIHWTGRLFCETYLYKLNKHNDEMNINIQTHYF